MRSWPGDRRAWGSCSGRAWRWSPMRRRWRSPGDAWRRWHRKKAAAAEEEMGFGSRVWWVWRQRSSFQSRGRCARGFLRVTTSYIESWIITSRYLLAHVIPQNYYLCHSIMNKYIFSIGKKKLWFWINFKKK